MNDLLEREAPSMKNFLQLISVSIDLIVSSSMRVPLMLNNQLTYIPILFT
jgi:hypothetical protein